MRQAIKKTQIIRAYRLGSDSPMEEALISEGVIRRIDEDTYELFSRESVNGKGQLARRGDYFKVDHVDGKNYAYPNKREYFEAKHRHIRDDEYEQINSPLYIWQDGDPMTDVMRFLLDSGKLTLDPEDPPHYFNAVLWGAPLSAARDATVVFYSIDRDENGCITDISFNFVASDYFAANYELCEDKTA